MTGSTPSEPSGPDGRQGRDGGGAPPGTSAIAGPERIAAVHRVINRGPVGERVERLVDLCARLLQTPYAQLSLLGATEQVVAAAHGVELDDTTRRGPVQDSLCTVTVASGRTLVVDDARHHPWVRELPPVTSGVVRSYLGVVLHDADGLALGSVCVYDSVARTWTDEQVDLLAGVGEIVAAELVRHTDVLTPAPGDLRARDAADAAQLGSFLYDFARTGLLDLDERMLALHGLTADGFDGTLSAYESVVHPDDLPLVHQRLARARETLGELVCDYRVLLPDAGTRWIRVRGRVMPDMLGEPSHVLGTAYDASTERDLQDELTRLMETMPAGLVRVTRDWTLTYVNGLAEDILRRTRQELVGTDVRTAFPDGLGVLVDAECARAMSTGAPGMVETHLAALQRDFEVRTWPDAHGLTLFFHDVTERRRAHQALEEAGARLEVLADAGLRLAGSLQPEEVLEALADLVVPAAGASLVLAVTDQVAERLGRSAGNRVKALHAVQVRHADPACEAELREVVSSLDLRTDEDSGVGRAVRTGQAQSLRRVPDAVMQARAVDEEHLARMRRLDTGPQLSVPLRGRTSVLGAMTVAGTDGWPLDEVLLTDLASRAAVALENALLFAEQDRTATVLQRALLPRRAPEVPDVLVATRYLPSNARALAGGDFFKTVDVDGRLVCALGDVMGHGTASAARAGQLHGLVAALALQGLGPADLLTQLSSGIGQMMDLEFATLLVCSYDPATRRLTAATAGHPAPLVAPVEGPPEYLSLRPGFPIGVAPDRYVEHTVELAPGSTLVLFSDGLVETRAAPIWEGLERLRVALDGVPGSPEAVADHILAALGAERGGEDDIALLVLSHPPGPPDRR